MACMSSSMVLEGGKSQLNLGEACMQQTAKQKNPQARPLIERSAKFCPTWIVAVCQ